MQNFIISFMNKFGYIGIALLIALENVFPPIPSEVILTFGGFMTTTTKMTVFGVVISSTIGAIVGATILYLVGRLLNADRLKKLVNSKVGKILRLKSDDIDKADNWFKKRGKGTVFFCRFIPIVRSLISIPAGMSKMNYSSFILLTTLGCVIWNIVLVLLGNLAGDAWPKIVQLFDGYAKITLIVLGAIIIIGIIIFYIIKKRKKLLVK
ncbi:MAG: DedA family protein [Bacilli bacterium]